jgi:DNA-directed RNA polymerase subunit RPC12/RpoP
MKMVCIRCGTPWAQYGDRWPKRCPYCASSAIRPVTPSSGDKA